METLKSVLIFSRAFWLVEMVDLCHMCFECKGFGLKHDKWHNNFVSLLRTQWEWQSCQKLRYYDGISHLLDSQPWDVPKVIKIRPITPIITHFLPFEQEGHSYNCSKISNSWTMHKVGKKKELDMMRFQVNEVSFEVICNKFHQPSECSQNVLDNFIFDP